MVKQENINLIVEPSKLKVIIYDNMKIATIAQQNIQVAEERLALIEKEREDKGDLD